MRFLNALVTAAESRGYKLEQNEGALAFVVDGQAVHFKLMELVIQTPHAPTEDEMLAMRKWESLLRRYSDAKGLLSTLPRPEIPEFDFAPAGRLQAVIAAGTPDGSGLRRTFGDGTTRQIETLINPILAAIATWAAVIGAQHGSQKTPPKPPSSRRC